MKNRNNLFLALLFSVAFAFLLPLGVKANTTVTFYIQGPGNAVLVHSPLVVPETCSVRDSAGIMHTFSGYKGMCALQAAKDSGLIMNFAVTDFGWGFSLDGINGIANTSNWSELWQLWVNGVLANVGIQDIALLDGDAFQLTYGPWITNIASFATGATGGGTGSSSAKIVKSPEIFHRKFNAEKAIQFLTGKQQKDGSFGAAIFTDWAAIAFGAYGQDSVAKKNLIAYFLTGPNPGTLLTDYERRAMALMALNINPYTGTSTNYVQKIVESFDGKQFGDSNLVNDDIFALVVLGAAGYHSADVQIQQDLSFVLQNQKSDGSWGDVDLTAAVVQALSPFATTNELKDVVSKAKAFLTARQEDSGSFGNVSSTSWAMQALASMGEDQNSWVKNNHTPQDYLEFQQGSDGGVQESDTNENRVWATSYAIPAAMGKGWNSILVQFNKPFVSLQPEQNQSMVVTTASSPNTLAVESAVPNTQVTLEAMQNELTKISEQVVLLQAEVATMVKIQAVKQELKQIAEKTQNVQKNIAQVGVQQVQQATIFPALKEVAESSAPLGNESAVQKAGFSAGLAQFASHKTFLFIVLAAAAIFFLLGGLNFINPFLHSKAAGK